MESAEDDPGFAAAVTEGRALSRSGRSEVAIEHFRRLMERHPDSPRAHFELAGAFDSAGLAAEAVAPYRRAMELGLAGEDVPRWYVQFGSTLRNVGEVEESVRLLTEGRDRFPDDAAIRVFRALALQSAGRDRDAVVELIDLVLREAGAIDLRGYERAIRAYVAQLRESTDG